MEKYTWVILFIQQCRCGIYSNYNIVSLPFKGETEESDPGWSTDACGSEVD